MTDGIRSTSLRMSRLMMPLYVVRVTQERAHVRQPSCERSPPRGSPRCVEPSEVVSCGFCRFSLTCFRGAN